MRIAIVGAGISGLTAALRLSERHAVTLFEAGSHLGGHTNTVDVELEGERHAIDTGFIVYNDWTYPAFIALLEELGVESQPTRMGFSVRCDRAGVQRRVAAGPVCPAAEPAATPVPPDDRRHPAVQSRGPAGGRPDARK
jgi:predicted NAD/FAD-binding protein